jgi:hypothetical protein
MGRGAAEPRPVSTPLRSRVSIGKERAIICTLFPGTVNPVCSQASRLTTQTIQLTMPRLLHLAILLKTNSQPWPNGCGTFLQKQRSISNNKAEQAKQFHLSLRLGSQGWK